MISSPESDWGVRNSLIEPQVAFSNSQSSNPLAPTDQHPTESSPGIITAFTNESCQNQPDHSGHFQHVEPCVDSILI
jgi:hypothetical protein